ncbi:VOC family protein [Silanimonas sp.]|uniref:VOC family protein n=1 Tax=Silanimonas sp. TaxID=1929290 RepID=UPI001BBFEBAC|nr:VOC family protein [Silanimonas sp.]MBS3896797.1 VOC family protein [Silanimonas sp.]MBS3924159.1 VOC family protein [Xanthomonadaceae bacterium]
MPRHAPPPGAPCWFELSSGDPARSLAFLQAVFGWRGEATDLNDPAGTYSFLSNANGLVGAVGGLPPDVEGTGSFWGVYFATRDLDASLARAFLIGGRVLADPFEVPGHGRGAVLADPGGALFHLWQPAKAAAGGLALFEDLSFGWVELATHDVAIAQGFYGELFGWRFSDSAHAPAGTRYSEYAVGDTHYGGLLQMPPEWGEVPAHWSLYVLVPDLDARLAATLAAGGTISVPAFEAPGVGRIARIDDPTGAGLYLVQPAAP